MNEAEAREIVKQQERQLNHEKHMNTQTVSQEYAYVHAKGYLAALEGPEVKALIQTLNNSLIIYRASQNQQELWEGWVDKFREKVREEFEI